MQKKEKEITNKSEIESIIKRATVCHLGLSENNVPYIVPLCFGYKENSLYIHGSFRGKKIDILHRNKNVCFQFDVDVESIRNEKACNWSMKYQSVIGFGKAVFIEDITEKRKGIDCIMQQYAGESFDLSEKALRNTCLIKIEIEGITGKKSGFDKK